jgi:hypothetical protein
MARSRFRPHTTFMYKPTVLLLAFAATVAAQIPANLAGVWELNKTASPSTGTSLDNFKIRIDQQGSQFNIILRATERGNLQQETSHLVIGQETKNEMHSAPATSRAYWDGATLVVETTVLFTGKHLRMIDRYDLSADGNMLTFKEHSQFGDEPSRDQVHVFERRPAASWEPDAPPKPAEEVYKNIQIMKGVPAPRLRSVMNNLTVWLGVECLHCHVAGHFEKDDLPAKQTARKMFLMVRAINHESFPDTNAVTCWTCHRGAAKAQSLPPQ